MKRNAWLVFFTIIAAGRMTAQPPDPNQTPPGTSPSQASPGSGQFDRPISWKLLIPNLISDQQRIWSFPVNVAQGQNMIATAAVLGTAAGLVLFDPTEASYFRQSSRVQCV